MAEGNGVTRCRASGNGSVASLQPAPVLSHTGATSVPPLGRQVAETDRMAPSWPSGGTKAVSAAPGTLGALGRPQPESRPQRQASPTSSPASAPAPVSAAVETVFAPRRGRASEPFAADAATRTLQVEQLLRANGAWPPAAGQLFVVQIDQDSPPAPPALLKNGSAEALAKNRTARRQAQERVKRYLKLYTGQLLVYRYTSAPDGACRLVELNKNGPYRSAAHPGQLVTSAKDAADFDNNGTKDIANLRSGIYQYSSRSGRRTTQTHGDIDFFGPLSDGKMRVARDLNQDGVITPAESKRTRQATATAIQIHPGDGVRPIAIGCQTIDERSFGEFKKIITGAKVETFTYVLVRRPNDETGENIW